MKGLIRRGGMTALLAALAVSLGGGLFAAEEAPAESTVAGPLLPSESPPLPYLDLDRAGQSVPLYSTEDYEWSLHVLPDGLIYRPYLAGPKESRMYTSLVRIPDDAWLWEGTMGARVGLLRVGTRDAIRPRGVQLDVEASAQIRLDTEEETDVRSTDYRVGVPLTWGGPSRQWKFGYYHISSHIGDEFWAKNPSFPRFAQARDVLVLGRSGYLTDSLRVYAEAGYAFSCVASKPWEFQFGVDYAPRGPTGPRGAPFLALNGHLREEVDFGGGFTAQAGWAWRSDHNAHLLRMGLQYYNGKSPQYVFLPYHEQQIGFGIWYDF